MGKIKLNLRNMDIPTKVQFARQVVTSLTGNTTYPTPDPPLADITTAADTLETAYNGASVARQSATTASSVQDDKSDLLDTVLQKLANYVESKSDGDEAKIQSAGMNVRAKPTPIGLPAMPMGLSVTEGDKEGELDLTWDRVYGSKSYVIEQSPDPITLASWKQVSISTKSNAIVSGLASGTKYWFRVSAVGAAGQGAWSDPATKYAP